MAWQYKSITIDARELEAPRVADGTPPSALAAPATPGLEALLEDHGQDGWELVSLAAERLRARARILTFSYTLRPLSYRAVLRRQVGLDASTR
jgi:hypothetical protein